MTTDQDPPREGMEDRLDRIGLFWWVLILVAACVLIAVLHWLGQHWHGLYWFRALLDGFWNVYDYSIERMRVLAAVVPLVLAFIAYRVYRADQWWKRAEWALDASVDESPARSLLGKKAITLLGDMNLAPPKDKRLFNRLTIEERNNEMLDEIGSDPSAMEAAAAFRASSPRNAAPVPAVVEDGVDDSRRSRR